VTGKKEPGKKETVDSLYRKFCAQDEVMIDGRCSKIILKPKERQVVYEELSACLIDLPKVNPIAERAKQRLFKELYKDKATKMRYIEYAGQSREEIEVT
jgi:hypothetical protein